MTNRPHPVKRLFVGALIAVFTASSAPPPAFADPPPWAPAHGYRAKEHEREYEREHEREHGKGRGKHHKREHYEAYEAAPTFGIDLGNCNRQLLGQALGAAAGAAAGSQMGKGDGRTAAIIGGTIIGLLVGGSLGRAMDQVDQNCVGQALERAETGQTITWHNPQTNAQYALTPTRIYKDSRDRYCREYTTTGIIDGKEQQLYGTACRQPDGSWEFVH